MSQGTLARALIEHIRLLKKQHAAGITPTFGQVEDLFDFAERLDIEVQVFSDPTLPCAIAGCSRAGEHRVYERLYCSRCARTMQTLMPQIQRETPDLAHRRIEAMVAGRTAWPTEAPASQERRAS